MSRCGCPALAVVHSAGCPVRKEAEDRAAAAIVKAGLGSEFHVSLSACGNPDFGQSRDIGVPKRVVAVTSLEEASTACQNYIAEFNLGSGNWTGGKVYGKGGAVVARISYNGRIWPVQS